MVFHFPDHEEGTVEGTIEVVGRIASVDATKVAEAMEMARADGNTRTRIALATRGSQEVSMIRWKEDGWVGRV